jgi:hypothetical protein
MNFNQFIGIATTHFASARHEEFAVLVWKGYACMSQFDMTLAIGDRLPTLLGVSRSSQCQEIF